MAIAARLTARTKKDETLRTGLSAMPLFVEPDWMRRQDGASAGLRRRPYHGWVF